jgi:hypothetical protein
MGLLCSYHLIKAIRKFKSLNDLGLQSKEMSHSTAGTADLLYRSSTRQGYSTEVSTHPGCVLARKLPGEVQAEFAPAGSTVQTPEGVVHVRPGDAILTGATGDRWSVPREHFAGKYQPVPPTVDGEAGRYVSLPYSIMAVPMSTPFEVLLADGVSRLKGEAGDWLVDYGDGSLGIVSPTIFAETYEVIG